MAIKTSDFNIRQFMLKQIRKCMHSLTILVHSLEFYIWPLRKVTLTSKLSDSSETLVITQKATGCHNPEQHNLNCSVIINVSIYQHTRDRRLLWEGLYRLYP
jgi:hypothetical protein